MSNDEQPERVLINKLESRLREAEAERDAIDAAFKKWREDARRIQTAAEGDQLRAKARAERAEAELAEAREALEWIASKAEPSVPPAWPFAYEQLVDRARGVLEKV